MKNIRYLLVFITGLSCLLPAGCADFRFASAWKDGAIAIDGKDTEWQEHMAQFGSLYLGVRNDAEYLYVCLSATDKMTKAQLMGLFRQNFDVWFDPAEKGKTRFGLRFSNESPYMNEALVNKVRFLKTPDFQIVGDEMARNMDIVVLTNAYPVAALADTKGIDVSAGVSMNGRKLTFEFKVPLVKSEAYPYAVDAAPGRTIGFGIETSPIDMDYVLGRMEKFRTDTGYGIRGRESQMNIEQEPAPRVRVRGRITLAGAERS